MLNGIGGSTVLECKHRITYLEFINWCLFRRKYGSLHLGMRVDRAVSRAATTAINHMAGKKLLDPLDLSPYDAAIAEAEEPELSFADAIAAISSAAKTSR